MQQRWQKGSLYQAHGAWHVRYYVAAIVDGLPSRVQRSKRLCDGDQTKKNVHKAFAEFMTSINEPGHIESDLTIGEFWEKTYQPFIEENLKHSTVFGYKQIWNQHLKNHLGNALLKEYRTPTGSLFLTKLARTYTKHTIQTIRSLACGLFTHAVNVGVCESNPWHDVKILGKTFDGVGTKVYSLEEIENVISLLHDHVDCQLIMALAFFAGLRKGEIQGLQWGDVDDSFIHIRRAVVRGIVGTPKTKKSVRSIPLIAQVRIPLMLWRNKGCDGWLFKGRQGKPADLMPIIRHRIAPVLQAAKTPFKGLHACRRGLGTTLRTLTGNSNAGRDLLGHSNDQVTKQHYEGAMPEEALKGMRLLEAAKAVKQLTKPDGCYQHSSGS